jgi:hypothetical protein
MGIFRAQLHMCADMQFAYFAIILRENMVFCTSDKYALHKVHSFGIFRSLFKISGFHYSSETKFFELPLELSLLLFST